MVSAIISRVVILLFGTLYPAYASYKAVKSKNVKEYVKWMQYWIVFALFTSIETFSDVFLSWVPFYYEVKILFVLWMLSPMTKGSSFLFKKFVHPNLARKEKDIDEMIAQARSQSYTTLLSLGSRGLTYASQMVVKTAMMGQSRLVDHLSRSYSTSDLSNDGAHRLARHQPVDDEDELDNRLLEDRAELSQRSASATRLTRSSSTSSAGLQSVQEEMDEDEEVVTITEEYTYPVTTRQHFSPREGEVLGPPSQPPSPSPAGMSRSDHSLGTIRRRSSSQPDHWSTPPSSPSRRLSTGGETGGYSLPGSVSSSGLSRLPASASTSAVSLLERYRGHTNRGGTYGSSTSLYSTPHSLPSSVLYASSSSSPRSSSSSSSLSSYGSGASSSLGSLSSSRQRRWGSWFTTPNARPRSSKF